MAPTKRSHIFHNPEIVYQALDDIKYNKISAKAAARMYGIPYTTLRDKLKGRSPLNPMSATLLTTEEELKLSQWLESMSELGFGKTPDQVCYAAKQLLDLRPDACLRKSLLPTKGWFYGFMARHPRLSTRQPLSMGKVQAVISQGVLDEWFHLLKENVEKRDPSILGDPTRIYTAHEIGFVYEAKSRKVLHCKGNQHVTTKNKEQVTVLTCMSASGHYPDPLLIYPCKKIPTQEIGEVFDNAKFQFSDGGCITESIFHQWIVDVFIPSTRHTIKPVLLLVDGHPAHTGLPETPTLCEENDIILHCLLPQASKLIHPLDQDFLRAIKSTWNTAQQQRILESGCPVTLEVFAEVLSPVWNQVATPEMAANSFRVTGIYPYDPVRTHSSRKLMASEASTASDDASNPSTSALLTHHSDLTPKPSTSALLTHHSDLTPNTSPPPQFASDLSPNTTPPQPQFATDLLPNPTSHYLPHSNPGLTTNHSIAPSIRHSLNSHFNPHFPSHPSSPESTVLLQQLMAMKDLCLFVVDEMGRNNCIEYFKAMANNSSIDTTAFSEFQERVSAVMKATPVIQKEFGPMAGLPVEENSDDVSS